MFHFDARLTFDPMDVKGVLRGSRAESGEKTSWFFPFFNSKLHKLRYIVQSLGTTRVCKYTDYPTTLKDLSD